MAVIDEIAAERQRQISAEGWAPEHDDEHTKGELSTAACCYLDRRDLESRLGISEPAAPAAWPWDLRWWKQADRRRDLVKAGALIVAEIGRLDRA